MIATGVVHIHTGTPPNNCLCSLVYYSVRDYMFMIQMHAYRTLNYWLIIVYKRRLTLTNVIETVTWTVEKAYFCISPGESMYLTCSASSQNNKFLSPGLFCRNFRKRPIPDLEKSMANSALEP